MKTQNRQSKSSSAHFDPLPDHAEEIANRDPTKDNIAAVKLYHAKQGGYFLRTEKFQVRKGRKWVDHPGDGSAANLPRHTVRSHEKNSPITESEAVDWYLANATDSLMAEAIRRAMAVDRLLTPDSLAVAKRMCRDHGLSVEEVIRTALDEALEQYEEDIAENGWMSGGENEWGFVRYAYRLRANQPGRGQQWSFNDCARRGHKVGSVSFYTIFNRRAVAKLKRTMGPLEVQPKKLAA